MRVADSRCLRQRACNTAQERHSCEPSSFRPVVLLQLWRVCSASALPAPSHIRCTLHRGAHGISSDLPQRALGFVRKSGTGWGFSGQAVDARVHLLAFQSCFVWK